METTLEEIKKGEIIEEENKSQKEEKIIEVALPNIPKGKYFEGIGRRKRSTARVRIWQNDLKEEFNILINDKNYKEYFKDIEFQKIIEAPLKKIKGQKIYKVTVKVKGGGKRGQAEAIRLGLSRALVLLNPEWKSKFKKLGFLTRDPREVERKKYGRRKARKEEQWQKR
jgi:small subunit ribosomal protein S9